MSNSYVTVRPGVEITVASFELFMQYANDAGNWSGTPLVDDGGNTGADAKANRGNLTQLKKLGLVTTFRSDGCNWLDFTDEGKRFAAINDVEYFAEYRPQQPLTDAVLDAAKELGVEVVTSELAVASLEDSKGLPFANVKPFEEVAPGDVGKDYGDESGTVIAKGTYETLKRYDSTGACDELEPELRDQLVAVQSDNETLLYVYGEDGFYVEN